MGSILFVIITGYLIGSIHSAHFLCKMLYDKDIRKMGSLNSGASNMLINYGKALAAIVLIFDLLKGVAAIYITQKLIESGFLVGGQWLVVLSGAASIIGHDFPFYLNFKGGKGTATFLGVMLKINPVIGIATLVIMLLVVIITRYIVIAVLIGYISFIIGIFLFDFERYGINSILILSALFIVSLILHIPNLKRISLGQELKVKKKVFFKDK